MSSKRTIDSQKCAKSGVEQGRIELPTFSMRMRRHTTRPQPRATVRIEMLVSVYLRCVPFMIAQDQ